MSGLINCGWKSPSWNKSLGKEGQRPRADVVFRFGSLLLPWSVVCDVYLNLCPHEQCTLSPWCSDLWGAVSVVGFIPESLKYVHHSHDFKTTSSVTSTEKLHLYLFSVWCTQVPGSLAGNGNNQEERCRRGPFDLIFSCWHQDVGTHQCCANLVINCLSTIRAASAIWRKKYEEQRAAGSDDKCMERFTSSHSCLSRVESL